MQATLPGALSQQNIAAGEATRRRVLAALQRETPARREDRKPRGSRNAFHGNGNIAGLLGFGLEGFGVTPFGT